MQIPYSETAGGSHSWGRVKPGISYILSISKAVYVSLVFHTDYRVSACHLVLYTTKQLARKLMYFMYFALRTDHL